MATVVASKPPPPHQKMKRPPPPAVQTNGNGAKSSQSSPSPSLGSKRPPSAFNHPPTAASSATGTAVNGITTGPTAARLSNRRRDSQKPGDAQVRSNKAGKIISGDNVLDRRKKMAEPYGEGPHTLEVKTASYILKKFKNKPLSLIIHLHAGHFRFDQQDGSFSYKSPMRFILEHLKSQTVPHDMIEELNAAGVKFYEGVIIDGGKRQECALLNTQLQSTCNSLSFCTFSRRRTPKQDQNRAWNPRTRGHTRSFCCSKELRQGSKNLHHCFASHSAVNRGRSIRLGQYPRSTGE
ncbi:MAG: hypothetical protein LQ352_007940 [Teloschistes flavicans]|nr:MAG: hypothetical protein LQ352_007940 [Teloschistes flavicans]